MLKSTILQEPAEVTFETVIDEIETFNLSGRNPFGPSVSHVVPVTVIFEVAGIDAELQFYPQDRTQSIIDLLKMYPGFWMRRAVIYPATRMLVAR